MKSFIREYLMKEVPIVITPELAQQIVRMVMTFEIRDQHPLTLNSQMFGVDKFIFTSRDRQILFDIIHHIEGDVKHTINKIPTINKDFKVVSDAFSIMCVYLAHLLIKSSLPVNLRHDSVVAILNYMQYRFIGSAVNHYFPHGANPEIMQTVVESLNMKFSVRQSGSWRNVVTERSESLSFDTKAHNDTLEKFDNDGNIST